MFDTLTTAAERRAANIVMRHIDRLAQNPTPPGITTEAVDRGIAITGKCLRRRMLTDPSLRNFGR